MSYSILNDLLSALWFPNPGIARGYNTALDDGLAECHAQIDLNVGIRVRWTLPARMNAKAMEGGAILILYAADIPNEGFHRFSVAHELGHYFLEGHIDHVLPTDGSHASYAGFSSGDPYEQEADNFAVGLLMPTKPFRNLMGRARLGLVDIEYAREACKTSLTSTAIRYAELTDDAIAVILSTGGVIDYCILSEAMKSLPDLTWLKRGSPVPRNTVTSRFNADGSRVYRAERDEEEIDVLDWLGGKRSCIVKEEVIGLGRYGKTLTVLSSRKIGQETYAEEGDDEDDLVERWTPRFKK